MNAYVKLISTILLFVFMLASLSVSTPPTQAQSQSEIERAALVALYNATDGDNWNRNDNWLEGDPCTNDWFGVSCSSGFVTNLFLAGIQLSGAIPAELGNLSNLAGLALMGNQLSGPIPAELGNLNNLELLYLYDNQLSGPIPAELGNLSSLTRLFLAGNQLSDAIPAELGNLSNLQGLYLDDNQLSGPIPAELGNLSNLQYLSLMDNQLSGSIPAELGNLSNLQYLDLDDNQLSGPIPAELGNLSNLTYLYLDNNQPDLCVSTLELQTFLDSLEYYAGPTGLCVMYDFDGFFPPVENPPAVNAVKAGQAVPVKFSLNGDQGLDIFADSYPQSVGTDCGASTNDIGDTTETAGNSELHYDANTDTYVYVWKTEKGWSGACRQLTVKLNDGTSHIAYFSFK